jgi:hypothetical protein
MSLDWFTTKMIKRLGRERYHRITTHPDGRDGPRTGWKWHPITESLVSLSVPCGFNEITERNALEISRRIATFERKHGASLTRLDPDTREIVDTYVTIEDVWNHVGLETNASKTSLNEFKERYSELVDPVFGGSLFDGIESAYRKRSDGTADDGGRNRAQDPASEALSA